MKIAAVVPTVKERKQLPIFIKAWQPFFEKHKVELLTFMDVDLPYLIDGDKKITQKKSLGQPAGKPRRVSPAKRKRKS